MSSPIERENINPIQGHPSSAQPENHVQSWLENGHPLGEMNGDVDVLNLLKQFSGHNFRGESVDTMKVFTTLLDKLQESDSFDLDKNMLAGVSSSMKQAVQLSEEIKQVSTEEEIKAFAERLKDRLKEEKVILIPLTDKRGKITSFVRMEAEKGFSVIGVEEYDAYSLKQENLREGYVKHTHVNPLTNQVVEELKGQQFHSFKSRNKEKIGDTFFFEALIKGIKLDDKNLESILFKTLPKYINGSKVSTSLKQHEMYKKGFRHGDLSTKNTTSLLYYLCMNPFFQVNKDNSHAVNTFKKVKFLCQSQAFIQCVRSESYEESDKKFIADVMRNLVRSADKLNQKGLIPQEHLASFFQACKKVEEQLDSSVPEQREPHVDIPFNDELVQGLLSVSHPTEFMIPPSINDGEEMGIFGARRKGNNSYQIDRNERSIKILSNPTKINTTQDLSIWNTRIEEILPRIEDNKLLSKALFSTLSDIVSTLPMPKRGGEGYWTALSEEDAAAYYKEVNVLSERIYEATRLTGNHHTPECSVMIFALYAIQLKLGTRLANLEEGSFNYSEFLYEMRSPKFIIHHPGIQKIIFPLMRFFNPNWDVEELTRKFSSEDFEVHDTSLLGFKVREYGDAMDWQLELNRGSMNSTQSYLQRLLQDDGRREAVKEILRKKNVKADEDFVLATEEYPGKIKEYFARKNELEAEEREVRATIESHMANEMFSEAHSKRVELYRIQGRIRMLFEPAEPEHGGYYPVDSELDQLAVLLVDKEGNKLIPEEVQQLIQSSLKAKYYLSYGTKKEFKFRSMNWGGLPQDKQNSREKLKFIFDSIQSYTVSNRVNGDQLLKTPNDINVSAPLIWANRSGLLTPNKAMVKFGRLFGLNVGQTRELRMLGMNPFDSVSQTLGFFGKHVSLIEKKAVQELIQFHLFRPERIHTQVRDNPEIARVMQKFINDSFRHYREIGDHDTCLYLVRLGNEFKELMNTMEVPHSFPDYRKVVLDELIPTMNGNKSKELQAYFTLVLLQASKKEVSDDLIKDVLTAKVSMNLQNDFARFNDEDQLLYDTILLRFASEINENELSNEVITHTVKVAVGDIDENLQWDKDESVYTSGPYSFDVNTGLVTVDGDEIVDIASWITGNTLLKKVYPFSITENGCKKIDEFTYIINPRSDREVTVRSYNLGRSIEIKRIIDGKEYRYIETPQELSEAHPTLFGVNEHFWLDEVSGNMIVREGEKTLYRINNHAIIRHADDAMHLNVSNMIAKFQTFEKEPNFIECWRKTNGTINFNFKRLGLSFSKKNGRDGLLSEQFPGYALTSPIQLDGLDEDSSLITLVNDSGDTKVLLPKIVDQSAVQTVENPMNWLAYDVVDNDIVPAGVEQKLYKVMLLALKGEYLQIKNLIDHLNPLERFTEIELKMIKNAGASLFQKQNPDANALALKLILLTELNRLKFPGVEVVDSLIGDEAQLGIAIQCYLNYVKEIGNTTAHRLSKEDERQLLDIFYARAKDHAEKLKKEEASAQEGKGKFLKKLMSNFIGSDKEIDLKGKLALFEMLLGNRFRSLSTKKGAMGLRAVEHLDVESIEKFMNGTPEAVDCYHLFEQYLGEENELPIPADDTIREALNVFNKEDSFWEENFITLYYVARSGSKEQKAILARELDLTEHHDSPYRGIVRKVSNCPIRYPAFTSFNRSIRKWKVDAQQKVEAAMKSLDDATSKMNIAEQEYSEINQENLDRNDDGFKEWNSRRTRAYKSFRAAVSHKTKMWKRLEKAQINETKAQGNLAKKIGGVSSNKLALVATIAKVFFKAIKLVFKLNRLTKTFLHKHIYPVRDIFSKKIAAKNETRLEFDINDFDRTEDSYFETMVEGYFQKDLINHEQSKDWSPEVEANSIVSRKLHEEKVALEQYRASLDSRAFFTLKDGADLNQLRNELEKKSGQYATSMVNFKSNLLRDLNSIYREDESAKLKFSVTRFGQKGELQWDDLKQISLAGNLESFLEKTGLSEEKAKKLMHDVARYLIMATRREQMNFVVGIIKKAEHENDGEKQRIYHDNIVTALMMKRNYKPDASNISRLWFEHANMYLYRKSQIEKLAELGQNQAPELLAEMPTGFGKTKNLIPTLDFDKSKEHLVFNVHPKTIEHINSEDVRDQLSSSFGRKADRFNFQRSTKFTLESLRKLYEEMQKDFEQGYPINLTSETLRSLELHFILTLSEYQNQINENGAPKDSKADEEIGYFIRILRAVRVHGWATIDEAHVNLDPNDKLIYTIGKSHTLPLNQLNILEEIFNILADDDQVGIRTNQQADLTEDSFNGIADRMADHFARTLKIKDENVAEFKEYVLGHMDTIPQWIEKHESRSEIALVKGQLSYVLKSCLKGYVDENFGLSKMHFDSKEYAISYSSSNTPKENENNPSQFKNPHETMNKTYLTYLHKGLCDSQVIKLISFLQLNQLEQFKQGVPMGETHANQLFSEICTEKDKVLNRLTEKEMSEIADAFKNNKKAIFYYIKHIIAPQLKLYAKDLVSTPQNFRSQFASTLSVTATPQDASTHGPDTISIPMEGTQGQVTHLFLKTEKIHLTPSSEPELFLRDLVKVLAENHHIKAVIDVGAQFRGLSNEFVAEQMCQEFRDVDHIKAVQYFDIKQEKFVMMIVDTGEIIDPAMTKIDPKEVITFYDQSRCTGSDIKLDKNAVGLLLVNKNTKKTIAGQGAGRMREWHLDQKIEVMMTGDRETDAGELLKAWISNDAADRATQNFHSQMQQMDNEIRRVLLDRMIGLKLGKKPLIEDETPNVSKAVKLFKRFESELVTTDSSDPWTLYSAMPTEQPSVGVLKEHHKRCLERAGKLGSVFSASSKRIRERLASFPEKWEGENAIPLPEKVKATAPGLGMECEVLQEVEVEEQVEQKVQLWNHFDERIPSKWSDSLDLFDAGWEKPCAVNSFFKRIGNKISRLEPQRPALKILFRAGLIVAGTAIAAVVAAVSGVALTIVGPVAGAIALIGIGSVIGLYFKNRNVKSLANHTYRVKDVMGANLPWRMRRTKQFFSEKLLTSNNYYTQQTGNWKQLPLEPFSQEQKPLFQVLVIKDGESVQMMLIDQEDARHFHKKLQKDYESMGEVERGRKVALYDVDTAFIAVQGKNRFDEGELEGSEEFKELLVQAKLINGELNYSDEEIDYLKRRNRELGNDTVKSLIEQYALSEHPNKKMAFPTSELAQRMA